MLVKKADSNEGHSFALGMVFNLPSHKIKVKHFFVIRNAFYYCQKSLGHLYNNISIIKNIKYLLQNDKLVDKIKFINIK
ncbi:hypothetical protein PAEVO_21000 [Paenibacillus sp. GM2FR]|nr:hypothetical protein PAEVO_21000 [Paenibacillus sp. GM2FR]